MTRLCTGKELVENVNVTLGFPGLFPVLHIVEFVSTGLSQIADGKLIHGG